MATYYHGNSEIQGGNDGLQTLILMNPNYVGVGYSDTQPPHQHPGSNFVFLNSNNPGNPLNFPPHAPPNPSPQSVHTQQFVGIPLTGTTTTSSVDSQHDISALHGFIPRVQYSLYNPNIDLEAARESSRPQQGLSLSLSPQRLGPAFVSQPLVNTNGDELRGSGGSSSSASGVSNNNNNNGVNNGMRSVLLSSKYLKAAQELLDEVVKVGKEVKNGDEFGKGVNGQSINIGESSITPPVAGDGLNGKRAADLSTSERQEIQMKKAKLLNMLDEVEQRYGQYHHQMQIVISWFEQVAGTGSAKTYTALALQTISKQFRCLKDAILGQIRTASKSLGEEDNLGGKIEGSRLKFVDNQLRQQRALQQLGMIQHNAWRPQRGLPERSVSVLRAWLFEHFLHPYPKDSDKIMLAKQTGLTRSQVSNWFINARVRLWKPMVEEMYMEEMKEQEKNTQEDKTIKNGQIEESTSKPKSPGIESQRKTFMPTQENTTTSQQINNHSGFSLIGSPEMESISQGSSPKKPRGIQMLHSPTGAQSINMNVKACNGNDEKQSRDEFTLMGTPTNFIEGFGSYTMGELGRLGAEQFPPGSYPGNGVSLTLGLPHCESLPLSANYRTFLPGQNAHLGRGMEIEDNDFSNLNNPTSTHSTIVYENLNIQNPKRFAAQRLPDFVA